MKKLLVLMFSVMFLFGSTLTVGAAGLHDVFSAKYYADQYSDLKAAFGYDEDLLWQHYMTYGIKEGRNMSPVLDVKEYREKYADLNAAFGDNWDAYVQHFFDYGINENRDNGTNFDVKTYIAAYSDIEEAFGNDFTAVVEHYLAFGIEEDRTLGDPVAYEEFLAPDEPEESECPETEDFEVEEDYDDEGNLIQVILRYSDGSMIKTTFDRTEDFVWVTVENYGTDGELVKRENYVDEFLFSAQEFNEDGSFTLMQYDGDFDKCYSEYNADGVEVYCKVWRIDGTIGIFTYYPNGTIESRTEYDVNGDLVSISYYDESGNLIEE